MPLLDDRGPIHAEDADVAVPHLVVVDEGDGAVREVRLHAVTLHPDGVGRPLGVIRRQGVRLTALAGDAQGRASGGGVRKEVDDLRLRLHRGLR